MNKQRQFRSIALCFAFVLHSCRPTLTQVCLTRLSFCNWLRCAQARTRLQLQCTGNYVEEIRSLVEAGEAAAVERNSVVSRECLEAAKGLLSASPASILLQLEFLMRIGDAHMLSHAAKAALDCYQSARRHLDDEGTISASIRAKLLVKLAAALVQSGELLSGLEELSTARTLLEASNQLHTEVGAEVMASIGHALVQKGDFDLGLAELQRAHLQRQSMGSMATLSGAQLLACIGSAYHAKGNFALALEQYQNAHQILGSLDMLGTLEAAPVLRGLGQALVECGDASAGLTQLLTAQELLESQMSLDCIEGQTVLMALGDAHTEVDNFDEALECFEKALSFAELHKMETAPDSVDVDELFSKIEDMRRKLRHTDDQRLFEPE
eukprot:TRINITY_DN60364_c0_g1_i1.p1 TRINITY_DN60364_c0_g1~~TRINITY_DN60364_c0_g1_i1.p1  ORF type:complete len:382 (-),score=76.24 TRINITY_DN60364_c0_g1_i1:141-1286(-)